MKPAYHRQDTRQNATTEYRQGKVEWQSTGRGTILQFTIQFSENVHIPCFNAGI